VTQDPARLLLTLTAQGAPIPAALLDQLAAVVLDQEIVRLALEVRAGGPHRLRRALELAAALCTRATEGQMQTD
jgi:hypothetical protein